MEQKQVNIAVKKIKELEFFINEEMVLNGPGSFMFGFNLTTNLNLNDNTVEFVISAIFSEEKSGEVFMKIRVSNVFLLLELADFHNHDNNEFKIPDNLMITFLSLSISHSRALLAKNAIGTKFADIIIPIVNPVDIFKQLFNLENSKGEI